MDECINLSLHLKDFLSCSDKLPSRRQTEFVYLSSKTSPAKAQIPLEKWESFCKKILDLNLPHNISVLLPLSPPHTLFLDLDIQGPEDEEAFRIKMNIFIATIMMKVFDMFSTVVDGKLFVLRADRRGSVRLFFINILLSHTDYVELCWYLQHQLEDPIVDMKRLFPGCNVSFDQVSTFPLPTARNDELTFFHVLEKDTRKRPIRTSLSWFKLDKDNMKSLNEHLPNVSNFNDLQALMFPIMTTKHYELLDHSVYCVQTDSDVSTIRLKNPVLIHVATVAFKNGKKKQYLYKNLSVFEQSSRHTYTVTESEFKFFDALDPSAYSEYSRTVHYQLAPRDQPVDAAIPLACNRLDAVLSRHYVSREQFVNAFAGKECYLLLLIFELSRMFPKAIVKEILVGCHYNTVSAVDQIDKLLHLSKDRYDPGTTNLQGVVFEMAQQPDILKSMMEKCKEDIWKYIVDNNEVGVVHCLKRLFEVLFCIKRQSLTSSYVFQPSRVFEEMRNSQRCVFMQEEIFPHYQVILNGLEKRLLTDDQNSTSRSLVQGMKTVGKYNSFVKEISESILFFWKTALSRTDDMLDNSLIIPTDAGVLSLSTFRLYTNNPSFNFTHFLPLSKFTNFYDLDWLLTDCNDAEFTRLFLSKIDRAEFETSFLEKLFVYADENFKDQNAFDTIDKYLNKIFPEIPACIHHFVTFLLLLTGGDSIRFHYLLGLIGEILLPGNRNNHFFHIFGYCNGKTTLLNTLIELLGDLCTFERTLKHNSTRKVHLVISDKVNWFRARKDYPFKLIVISNEFPDAKMLENLKPVRFDCKFVDKFDVGDWSLRRQFSERQFLGRKSLSCETKILAGGALFLGIQKIKVCQKQLLDQGGDIKEIAVLDSSNLPSWNVAFDRFLKTVQARTLHSRGGGSRGNRDISYPTEPRRFSTDS